MKPVVTIGMCMRNSERFVKNAIDSIIRQDFPHELMEIVFVDDGSTDSTFRIVSNYAARMDIRAKVFQTRWQGLGPARNLVFRNAEGEYIIWVDADQILPERYVRDQVEFMEKNPDVGITCGLVKTVPENLILSLELVPMTIDYMRFEEPRSFIWKTEKLPGTGGATVRVKALRQIGGFDERLKGVGEDQDIDRRMKEAGWAIRMNSSGFYELHGGMTTIIDLLRKYRWYGRGNERLYRKNRNAFSLPRMCPPAGFLTGLLYSLIAYRKLHEKKVFLLPLHFGLKMTAWTRGFVESQIMHMTGRK